MSSGSGRLQTGAASGFTKPPVWGMRWTLWRSITVLVVSVGWVAATVGRLHPVWVAIPVVVLALLAFSTVYHVTLTRWVERRWSWWRRRRAATAPQWPAALDVPTGGVSIGVVSENETLTMMVELRPDPIAPSVVTDTEERTINTISIAMLTEMMNVLDVELDSIDLLGDGFRAVGPGGPRADPDDGPDGHPAGLRADPAGPPGDPDVHRHGLAAAAAARSWVAGGPRDAARVAPSGLRYGGRRGPRGPRPVEPERLQAQSREPRTPSGH